jgi:thiamine kinase-like enzyme
LKRALGVERLGFAPHAAAAERRLIRGLRRLDLGRGPLVVEPISGGISNHNFAVRAGDRTFFARLCQDRARLGIDRRNELACHQAASRRGIAPEVVYHEEGLLVCRFVVGRTLESPDLQDAAIRARLVTLLDQLHRDWDLLTGPFLHFCPFQTVRTYAQTASRLMAKLPEDIDELLADMQALARRIAPFRPVLCHNDLLPANLIDDGDRLWLVDWEYGGAGHPLFDLANASANAALADDQELGLLEAYRGHVADRDLFELRVFKAASLLRESLWSTIQSVAADIEFDYRRYASDNLRAYRVARARVP